MDVSHADSMVCLRKATEKEGEVSFHFLSAALEPSVWVVSVKNLVDTKI